MRAVSTIYRRELSSYLRSPIGYIIAATMLLVCGVLFQSQALGKSPNLSAIVLSEFFRYCSGCTIGAAIALSIRLISEERQQHTIVLLNTSPVRDAEIIAGKFLAALTFLSLIVLASFYMPMLIKVNGKITMAQVLVGYLGLILLGAAFLAVGIFASALTRHQLVAGTVALGITVIMLQLYPLGLKLDEPLRSVFKSLDLWHEHFGLGFMKGVLNLKDVVYYVAVTYFFLMLATRTLEAKRWR
jgi:ABC-2 type transport system permease protein